MKLIARSISLLLICGFSAAVQSANDPLFEEFLSPPNSAKPPILLHYSAVAQDEQHLDSGIDWLKRVGLASRDCNPGDGPHLEDERGARRLYMSQEWRNAFHRTADVIEGCGIQLLVPSEPGYAGIGGRGTPPEQAMKKLVWSRTVLQGARPFVGLLKAPPKVTGPFEDVPKPPFFVEAQTQEAIPQHYQDVAVIGYRLPQVTRLPEPSVTSREGKIDAELLSDGDLLKGIRLEPKPNDETWIEFTYAQPVTVRSAVLGTPVPAVSPGEIFGPMVTTRLDVQDDSGVYHPLTTLRITSSPQVTVSFSAVTAKKFRFVFLPSQPDMRNLFQAPDVDLVPLASHFSPPKEVTISELALSAETRVNEGERKAGFAVAENYYRIDTPDEKVGVVPLANIVDLTSKMSADGVLKWTPPAGEWVVLRLGYSLVGKQNHPAPPEATGLEVDNLNSRYVHEYMSRYMGEFTGILSGPISSHRRGLFLDSIETGIQNWTDDMPAEFERLRGYGLLRWLPAMTGVVIQSADATDRFLWDFRRTIAQMLAVNFYGQMANEAHARGLPFYAEALESGRGQLGDDIEMRSYADVPMGAMWNFEAARGPFQHYLMDIRGAASTAHIYGRSAVMAESFTDVFQPESYAPADLKVIADLQFVSGINRMLNTGVTKSATWADDAEPWVSYLASSSYLLQQGRFVADVAYLYGEEAPLVGLAKLGLLDDLPKRGYAYDFVSADALLKVFDTKDGYLTTPSGMRYRILQLGGLSDRMTVPVLRKLRDLVERGAIILGKPPIKSPSFADDVHEFDTLVKDLWGNGEARRSVGNGQVFGQGTVEDALAEIKQPPDFESAPQQPDVAFLHRTLPQGEIYFVTNRSSRAAAFDATFRLSDKSPEIWRADKRTQERVAYTVRDGRITVPLRMNAWDSFFVVFRNPVEKQSIVLPRVDEVLLATMDGPWHVSFQSNRGAPNSATFQHLTSWSENSETGIKFFSGSADYTSKVFLSEDTFKDGGELLIDLGDVSDIATMTINGRNIGTLWDRPYRLDATKALRPGENIVQVKVINMWTNRSIGDAQPHTSSRYFKGSSDLFGDADALVAHPFKPDAKLRPAGLLGPVSVLRRKHADKIEH